MPILKGAMGYTRFFLRDAHKLSPDVIVDKLAMFKFRPLHPRGEDYESAGWCAYRSEYDHEKDIVVKDFYYDQQIMLCMRVDVITLPKPLLKSLVKKSISAYAREHGRHVDKTTMKQIELAEAKGLRERVLPKITIVEAIWSQQDQSLRVFSRSQNVLKRFLELFEQSFSIRPERQDFPVQALDFADKKQLVPALENLKHQPLFMPPLRVDVQ